MSEEGRDRAKRLLAAATVLVVDAIEHPGSHDVDQISKLLERVFDLGGETTDNHLIVKMLLVRAKWLLHRQHLDQVEEDLRKGFDIAYRNRYFFLMVDARLGLSRLFLARGEPVRAKNFLEEARHQARELGYRRRDREMRVLLEEISPLEVKTLETTIRELLRQGKIMEARPCFMELLSKYPDHPWGRELGFLFDAKSSEREDLRRFGRQKDTMLKRARLWCILSTPFDQNLMAEETKKPETSGAIKNRVPKDKPHEPPDLAEPIRVPPVKSGEMLEKATLALFRIFFEIAEKEAGVILKELGRQRSGYQFGHDLSFSCRVKGHGPHSPTLHCQIECKNKQAKKSKKRAQIKLNDFADKVWQCKYKSYPIDYWILIATGPLANDATEMVRNWQADRARPFDILVWSPKENVEEFFSLDPSLKQKFFAEKRRSKSPSEEQRQEIYDKWMAKLKPPVRLPRGFTNYLTNQNRWCFGHEVLDDFNRVAEKGIQLGCGDPSGAILEVSLEQYVLNWLKQPLNNKLLILAEFGEGKSAFTFCLTRKLIESFWENPRERWFPIRFSLKEFYQRGDSKGFIQSRLEEFGADLSGWYDLLEQNRVLAILDGFDEMTTAIDPESIRQNIDRLEDCFDELNRSQAKDVKVLLTSRLHFFRNQPWMDEMWGRLGEPEQIHMALATSQQVLGFLKNHAKGKPAILKKIHQLASMNHPLGVASKVVYLPMLLNIIEEVPERELTEEGLNRINIYQTYLDGVFWRRGKEKEWGSPLGTARPDKEIQQRLYTVLENIALDLHWSGKEAYFLRDIQDRDIAGFLWKNANAPEHQQDAATRLQSRTILTAAPSSGAQEQDQWPVTFSHRSWREFFVARGIYRFLSGGETEEAIAKKFGERLLTHEILGFTVGLMARDQNADFSTRLKTLIPSVSQTGEVPPYAGANAANLLNRGKNGLPGADWSRLVLDHADFTNANLARKNFSYSRMQHVVLNNADMSGTNLSHCTLTGMRLEETAAIQALGIQPDPRRLFAVYSDGTLRSWDLDSDSRKGPVNLVDNIKGPVHWLDVCSANAVNAFIGETIYFFDFESDGKTRNIHQFKVYSGLRPYGPNLNTLLTTSSSDHDSLECRFHDLKSGLLMKRRSIPKPTLLDLVSENKLAYYRKGSGIFLDSVEREKSADPIHIKAEQVTCMRAHCQSGTDKIRLAAGHQDGTLCIWDVDIGSAEQELLVRKQIHRNAISALQFFDWDRLVTGSLDRKILVLEITSDCEVRSIPGYGSLHLTIKCDGMTFDGVKGPRERKILEDMVAKRSVEG